MLEPDTDCGDEVGERVTDAAVLVEISDDRAAFDARRRIERLRELRRLRELLDDPEFTDLE